MSDYLGRFLSVKARVHELESMLAASRGIATAFIERTERAEAERDAIETKTIERCAEIASKSETYHDNGTGHWKGGWHAARKDIVEAIRALKPSEETT